MCLIFVCVCVGWIACSRARACLKVLLNRARIIILGTSPRKTIQLTQSYLLDTRTTFVPLCLSLRHRGRSGRVRVPGFVADTETFHNWL